MFFKFDDREKGKRFTFFKNGKVINGEKIFETDKCVYGTLSDGINKVGKDGKLAWENDYWNVTFCGKALDKARTLEDKDRITVVEMNIRNVYSKTTKKSYPQITVTDFDVNGSEHTDDNEDMFANMAEEEMPFC